MFRGQPAGDSTELCQILKDLDTLTPLAEGKFVACDHITIADLATVVTVTFLEAVDFNMSAYPNIVAWIEKMKALPYFEECNAGFEQFKKRVKAGEFRK